MKLSDCEQIVVNEESVHTKKLHEDETGVLRTTGSFYHIQGNLPSSKKGFKRSLARLDVSSDVIHPFQPFLNTIRYFRWCDTREIDHTQLIICAKTSW